MPVSSSRFMKVIPPAVAGRCRWVTMPPTSTRRPCSTRASFAIGTAPTWSSRSRMNCAGWRSGESPVAQTSATSVSTSSMPGNAGAFIPVAVPGSRPARSCAAAPAAHSASRLVSPKQAKASAVASASRCAVDSSARRATSSMSRYGPCARRSSSIRLATSSPSVRTDSSPIRTAGPPSPHWCGASPRSLPHRVCGVDSRVALASLALMSGRRTSTPCRRASSTSDCGE